MRTTTTVERVLRDRPMLLLNHPRTLRVAGQLGLLVVRQSMRSLRTTIATLENGKNRTKRTRSMSLRPWNSASNAKSSHLLTTTKITYNTLTKLICSFTRLLRGKRNRNLKSLRLTKRSSLKSHSFRNLLFSPSLQKRIDLKLLANRRLNLFRKRRPFRK